MSHTIRDTALAVISLGAQQPLARPDRVQLVVTNAPRPSTVQSDHEAVELWLHAKTGNSVHTNESYRRESQKLLLWLAEQQLTLGAMTLEHVHAYYHHLGDPPPHWIRPRKVLRDADLLATQVLASGANATGLSRTRMLMANLYAYLQDLEWVRFNPFKLSMKPPRIQRTTVTRVLDVSAWQFLRDWARTQTECSPHDDDARRQRWLLMLLYHAGLRREEVADGRMGDFLRSDHGWKLRVVGKGSKERFVSIDSVLLEELTLYRAHLNLLPLPLPQEDTPLIAPLGKRGASDRLTARSINHIVDRLVARALRDCTDDHIAANLQSVSPHYFRHTNATHRLKAGATLKSVQSELGHSSIATTGVYLHVDDAERAANAELLAQFDRAASTPIAPASGN